LFPKLCLVTRTVKIKVKVVPLLQHHATNAYGGVELNIHSLLNSALLGGEPSALHYGAATLPLGK